jgi:hypothetical protein
MLSCGYTAGGLCNASVPVLQRAELAPRFKPLCVPPDSNAANLHVPSYPKLTEYICFFDACTMQHQFDTATSSTQGVDLDAGSQRL